MTGILIINPAEITKPPSWLRGEHDLEGVSLAHAQEHAEKTTRVRERAQCRRRTTLFLAVDRKLAEVIEMLRSVESQ
jgi:hypothetical protein